MTVNEIELSRLRLCNETGITVFYFRKRSTRAGILVETLETSLWKHLLSWEISDRLTISTLETMLKSPDTATCWESNIWEDIWT